MQKITTGIFKNPYFARQDAGIKTSELEWCDPPSWSQGGLHSSVPNRMSNTFFRETLCLSTESSEEKQIKD